MPTSAFCYLAGKGKTMQRHTAYLGARVEPPLLAAVKRAAARDRLHVSEFVRAALLAELQRRKQAPGKGAAQ